MSRAASRFGKFTRPNFHFKVRRRIDAAKAVGEVPVFTLLRAEANKCTPGYQGGGPREDRATRKWYDAMARAIGDDRVIIAFEPDSLGTIDCLAPSRRDDRYKLLRYGVDALSKLPNSTIYLEAGASDWESASLTAKKLKRIGVAKVRGFMLNATHYDWTAANIKHGLEISRKIGGKHFIVNTAENGRGPVHYRRWIDRSRHIWRTIDIWCNPGLRGLGPLPTTTPPTRRGRLPVDQPARLRAVVLRPQDRLVRAAGVQLRALRHELAAAAARHRASGTSSATRRARSGFPVGRLAADAVAARCSRRPPGGPRRRRPRPASRYGSGLTGVS